MKMWRTERWVEISIKRWNWFWSKKSVLEMRRGTLKRAICNFQRRGGGWLTINLLRWKICGHHLRTKLHLHAKVFCGFSATAWRKKMLSPTHSISWFDASRTSACAEEHHSYCNTNTYQYHTSLTILQIKAMNNFCTSTATCTTVSATDPVTMSLARTVNS